MKRKVLTQGINKEVKVKSFEEVLNYFYPDKKLVLLKDWRGKEVYYEKTRKGFKEVK